MSVFMRSKLTLDPEDPRTILFYTPYGQLSEPLPLGNGKSFREKIAPFAFSDSVRGGDVFCFFNHNPDLVLGHQSENFTIREKMDGLRCRVKLEYGDLEEAILDSVAQGEMQCSVGFKAIEESWPEKDLRVVEKGKLIEISLARSPVYRQTSSCLSPPPAERSKPEQVKETRVLVSEDGTIAFPQTSNIDWSKGVLGL